jgi:hypothetical protein
VYAVFALTSSRDLTSFRYSVLISCHDKDTLEAAQREVPTMVTFMTVLAIIGWLQALRISRKFDRLLRMASLEIDAKQDQIAILQQQLNAATRWSNHE